MHIISHYTSLSVSLFLFSILNRVQSYEYVLLFLIHFTYIYIEQYIFITHSKQTAFTIRSHVKFCHFNPNMNWLILIVCIPFEFEWLERQQQQRFNSQKSYSAVVYRFDCMPCKWIHSTPSKWHSPKERKQHCRCRRCRAILTEATNITETRMCVFIDCNLFRRKIVYKWLQKPRQ